MTVSDDSLPGVDLHGDERKIKGGHKFVTQPRAFSPDDWKGPAFIFWDDAYEWGEVNKIVTTPLSGPPAEILIRINAARRGYGLPEFWITDFRERFGGEQPLEAFDGALGIQSRRAA